MLGKAGLVAAIAVAAIVSGRSIDMRSLYDQMYPVSTLKRDVLNLCHENDPTFVRAWRGDRVACYSGMPHAIALALGFIHPSTALAELFSPFGGADSLLAAAGLAGQLTMSREPPLTAPPRPGQGSLPHRNRRARQGAASFDRRRKGAQGFVRPAPHDRSARTDANEPPEPERQPDPARRFCVRPSRRAGDTRRSVGRLRVAELTPQVVRLGSCATAARPC